MKEAEAFIDLKISGKINTVEAVINALKESSYGKYIENIKIYYE